MPLHMTPKLHMTKVAFQAQSLKAIHGWFATRGEIAHLTTRYLPKRHAELVGGSLFWIHKHQLVARSPIVGFEATEDGRTNILISTTLIDVHPVPRRAHQGWRYLADADAPRDLGEGEEAGEVMSGRLAGKLAKLGLI